ncbi:hypothetical protein [Salipaludibacillus daqingensis]|uniref:hypothetical protein n=1 Tax=Salipaludibacillus daqingensis TaxID=3041001 RepID=UPI0024756F11|nr:hypothetical protein [Salipaludibacillus daqingensis]
MKWSILQLLTVFVIVFIMWFLENISQNRTTQPASGEWTAINSPYITFVVIALVVTCFYLIFMFQAKKENNLYQHRLWSMMPKLIGIVGFLSIVLFLIGGTIGPIMTWVEQWRSLIYVFLVYFLFLIFLFIFSFEHKRQRFRQQNEKTILISFIWTLLLFFGVFFIL